MLDVNRTIAMLISFFLAGLGVAYLGNYKKGLTIFLAVVVCHLISIYSFAFSVIEFLIWAYGMYATYQEATF